MTYSISADFEAEMLVSCNFVLNCIVFEDLQRILLPVSYFHVKIFEG